ncbi:MAG: hypothetical protein EA420_00805 [Candidatus Competibacteraceae bacterium]|nr:MAG: hypothetical protein EA420_00805 [Candidatus Competibacteraceae bacterium]
MRVAHFSQQVLFCLFAEDIALLPGQLFAKLLQAGLRSPADARTMLESLFGAMAAAYGWADYGPEMPDDEILSRLLALNLERAARVAAPDGRGGSNDR